MCRAGRLQVLSMPAEACSTEKPPRQLHWGDGCGAWPARAGQHVRQGAACTDGDPVHWRDALAGSCALNVLRLIEAQC